MTRLKSSKGFTLIELIVVIIIIGILVAIAAVAYNSFITNSKKSVVEAAAAQYTKAYTAALAYDVKGGTVDADAQNYALGQADSDLADSGATIAHASDLGAVGATGTVAISQGGVCATFAVGTSTSYSAPAVSFVADTDTADVNAGDTAGECV